MTSSEVRAAAEAIFDALEAADASYHDRTTGVIDITGDELAAALLAAGWRPPIHLEHCMGTVGNYSGSAPEMCSLLINHDGPCRP